MGNFPFRHESRVPEVMITAHRLRPFRLGNKKVYSSSTLKPDSLDHGELDLTEVHEIIRNTRTSSSGPNGPGTLCDWLEALQVCGVGFLEASDARQGQASGTSHRSARRRMSRRVDAQFPARDAGGKEPRWISVGHHCPLKLAVGQQPAPVR